MTDTTTTLEFKTVPFDLNDPLAPIPGESRKTANVALRDYFYMGSGRSLRKLLDKYNRQVTDNPLTETPPSTNWGTLSGWSVKYYWQERVRVQDEIDRRAEALRWEQRRDSIRQADYDTGQALRDLAAKIQAEAPKFLKASHKFVKGKDGQPDREIHTIALDAWLMLKAIETASKLERQAAEIEEPARRVIVEVEKELQKALDRLEKKLDSDTFYRVLAALSDSEVSEAEARREP